MKELKDLLKKKDKEILDNKQHFIQSMESAKKQFNQRINDVSRSNVELEISYKSRIAELNTRIDSLHRILKEKERKEKEIVKRLSSDFNELSGMEEADISVGK